MATTQSLASSRMKQKQFLLDGESSERLNFRKARQSDFEQWLPFFIDPNTSKHWAFEPKPPVKLCEDWYQKQFQRYEQNKGGMNALIEKGSDRLVGHCGLLVQTVDGQTELEIGYSLLPAFWGRGFASEAAKKCRDFAFENGLTDSLISTISLTNKPSEKVAYANGMTIDKQTEYNSNQVNIFRIQRSQWLTIYKI